jgi:hypothetical protein
MDPIEHYMRTEAIGITLRLTTATFVRKKSKHSSCGSAIRASSTVSPSPNPESVSPEVALPSLYPAAPELLSSSNHQRVNGPQVLLESFVGILAAAMLAFQHYT